MSIRFFIPFALVLVSLSSCGQGVSQTPAQEQTQPVSVPVDTVPVKVRNYTRFEKEILRFEESDQVVMPASGGILFVGSSSIRLWRSLAEDMAPLPVINRGFGGATIGEVNYYFRRIVAKYKPRLLVFYAGENDLYTNMPVDSVVQDFNHFRDSMNRYLPDCRMYFIGIKPSPARWDQQAKFEEANLCFKEVCARDPRWNYVDVGKTMLDTKGLPRREIYRADSLHMNGAGYAEWTKVLKPVLKVAWKTVQQTASGKP